MVSGFGHRARMRCGVALFETACSTSSWFIEPNRLVVRRVEIVSEDWEGAPLTIAAISDTHVGGPHVDAARMGRIVARINALRPELVVLLGDYVNGHHHPHERTPEENQEITGGIATFAALRARYGAVAVIGNHDVWYDRQTVTTALQDAGVAALWNRHIVVRRTNGEPLVVAGLERHTGSPDYAAALDARQSVRIRWCEPLAEQFARGLTARRSCSQATVLRAGTITLGRPILPLRILIRCGLIEEKGIDVRHRGHRTSIAPLRFLNPPEIVLITLRALAGGLNARASPSDSDNAALGLPALGRLRAVSHCSVTAPHRGFGSLCNGSSPEIRIATDHWGSAKPRAAPARGSRVLAAGESQHGALIAIGRRWIAICDRAQLYASRMARPLSGTQRAKLRRASSRAETVKRG